MLLVISMATNALFIVDFYMSCSLLDEVKPLQYVNPTNTEDM